MVGCGHQLGCSDDSGWLMSSSAAAPVGGSANTALILHKIMADELYEAPLPMSSTNTEFLQSKRIDLSSPKERESKLLRHRESRIALRRTRVDSYHDFSDFDESEHNDGCPVKWLFRRQSTESWRSCASPGSKQRPKGLPKEIQIKKMGLRKRVKKAKELFDHHEHFNMDNYERPLNAPETPEDDEESDESSNLKNFLYPRPLTGIKPWMYIFLEPKTDRLQRSALKTKPFIPVQSKQDDSPRVSVQSIHFPDIERPSKIKTRCSRRIKKSARTRPAYKPPALLDIVLHEKTAKEVKLEAAAMTEEVKPYIEEDRLYRLRKFFNIEPKIVLEEKLNEPDEVLQVPLKSIRKKSREKVLSNSSADAILLVSSKVQFFQRPGKPMR